MDKKTLLIIGGIVAVLGLCACAAITGFGLYNLAQHADPLPVQVLSTPEEAPTAASEIEDIINQAVATGEAAEPNLANNQARAKSTPLFDPESLSKRQAAADVANAFLTDVMDKKYEEAAGLTSSEMSKSGDTAASMRTLAEDQGMLPDTWAWMDVVQQEQVIELAGAIHFQDLRRGLVNMRMVSEDNQWRVGFVNFKVEDGTVDPGTYTGWTNDREKEEFAFAKSTVDDFLLYWQQQDYESAWHFTAQPLRDTLKDDSANLPAYLAGLKKVPADWKWDNNLHADEITDPNPILTVKAVVNYQDGTSGTMTYKLMFEDNYWYILYMVLE